ncbi:MAG: DUF6363 domain-containing protein, partial [Bacteroidota bacterium]
FQATDYRPCVLYFGVSGGSINATNILIKQYSQFVTAIRLLAQDVAFTQLTRTFGAQGYMDIDYLKRVAAEKVPLDLPTAMATLKTAQVYFVATNLATGQAAYLQPTKQNWLDILVASSTLPLATKGRHAIDDIDYFDGGWSDPLPARWAYEQGAKRILVIRTAPAERHTTQSYADYFASIFYRNNPHLKAAFANCHTFYNDSVNFLLNPPDDLIVEQIAPIKELKSTTYTYTNKTIMSDYRYGLDEGIKFVQKRRGK